MKNFQYLVTSFLFYLGISISLSFSQNSLEMLEEKLAGNLSSEQRIATLNDLAELLKRNYPKAAFRYGKEAYELAKAKDISHGYALASIQMGDSKWNQGYYQEAYAFFDESKDTYTTNADSLGIALASLGIAKVDWRFGNYPQALSHALRALGIRNRHGDSLMIADSYYWLGVIQTDLLNFSDAISYQEAALRIARNHGDKQRMANILNYIGRAYRKQEEYEPARKIHHESLQLYRELGDSLGVSDYYNNVGSINRREGKYEQALEDFFHALEIQEKLNDQEGMADGFNDIGTTYMQMGSYGKAIDYLKQGLEVSEKTGLKDDMRYAYASLSAVYDSLNDYSNAYFFHQKYMEIKDSLLDQQKNQIIAELINQHENESDNQRLRLLELSSERNRLLGFLLFAALIISLVFIIWMVTRSRLQSRLNKELSHKNRIIQIEKQRSEDLLLNILPKETAEELMMYGKAKARSYDEVSVLFSDFAGFTQLSEELSPRELVAELHHCFEAFDRIVAKYGIEKIKTIGDAYMCVSGLPVKHSEHALNMVKAGLEMQAFLTEYRAKRMANNSPYFEARIGVHSGPVVAGIVGIRKFSYDIWGDTVNMASRMEDCGGIGKVNISAATYKIVQNHFICQHRGQIDVKHKGKMDMYYVEWQI